MCKIDCNNKFFPKNIKKLNKNYENKNNKFKTDTVKNVENYSKN